MASMFPFLRISRTGQHIHRLERILLKALIRDRIIYKIQARILGRSPESVRNIASREMPGNSYYGSGESRTNITVDISTANKIQKTCSEYGLTHGRFVELAISHMISKGVLADAEESPLESVRLLKSPGFGEEWKELERVLLFDADRLRHDSLPLNAVESPSASILPKVNGYSQFGSHNAGK